MTPCGIGLGMWSGATVPAAAPMSALWFNLAVNSGYLALLTEDV